MPKSTKSKKSKRPRRPPKPKKPEKRKGKTGPVSCRMVARLPRNAGHRKQVQHAANLAKSESTMAKYRKGWKQR